MGAAAEAAPQPPDPAQAADAVARFLALREFRARLYGCLTSRPDALFELCDAVLCADHAVTSLVQLSLEAEFTRGHGALYGALAAGIDEEAFAALLTATLPPLAGGEQGRAWTAEHDTIDYGLLEAALAGLPAARPAPCGRRARGGAGCGSRSTLPPTRGRTPSAPRKGSTCIMTRAAATAPARASPAGNTSSWPRSGTCVPHGPR